MPRYVPLDNVEHADLRVRTGHAAEWGDAVNQVLALPSEFEQLQREYPILFRRDDAGRFYAVALLGLDLDENLFLGADGWEARYVPAARRQGPFALGPVDGEPAIHIDLDDPRVGASAGEPLYRRHGGQAPYLQQQTAVLEALRQGHAAVTPFFTALGEHALIRPVSLDIALDDGTSYQIDDVFAVDEERLAALDGGALPVLHRAGFLRAAIMAAASLANIGRLIERRNARDAGR